MEEWTIKTMHVAIKQYDNEHDRFALNLLTNN